MGKLARGGITAVVVRWASGLRFPWLFLLTASLFAVNMLVPDAIPLVDELLMGLAAAMLASLRKKPDKDGAAADSGKIEENGDRADTNDAAR
jgi:hypothetical protein